MSQGHSDTLPVLPPSEGSPYLLTHGRSLSLDGGTTSIMAAFTLYVPSPLSLIRVQIRGV